MIDKLTELILEKEIDDCKGIVWRGIVNSYFSSHNSIETKKSLRILKRKSCPGCEKCGWLTEFMQEEVSNLMEDDYLKDIVNGKMYRIEVLSYFDYENGCWEIDGVDIVEIK